MQAGDRLICVLTETQTVGATFKDWLLHVTIVPWFRLEIDTSLIVRDLEKILDRVGPFEVVMSEQHVQFGHQKGKLATLVRLPSSLIGIEKIVRDYLHGQSAWLVDESTRHFRDFRPHVTAQQSGSLRTGDRFRCDRLYIIEQAGGHKKVAGEIGLSA
jgi:hypothetical protein